MKMKMKIGKKYKFSYLRNIDEPTVDTETCYSIPKLFDYSENVKTYTGTLKQVRDISKEPLSSATLKYKGLKGKRSQNLMYFEMEDGDIKGMYDGSIIAVEEIVSKTKTPLLYSLGKVFRRKRRGALSA
jgi:hypothetical protein|tara:strand:+ start:1712 stop:2098 length:387 start_codon:yes stop_codon:yes gene_type:complete